MNHSTPGLPVHHRLPEFTQTHVHWVGDAIQPSHPLSSPSLPAFNLSQHQGLFQWVNSLHQVTKYWSFSFSISPSNEYSGLITFRMHWLDLLAVQGTLKSFYSIDNYSLCVLHHPCSQEITEDSAEDLQRTVCWTRIFCLVCSYFCWPCDPTFFVCPA